MTKRVEFPQSHCRAGVAEGDITPPVGTYHRMWGAAAHERSTGVHRPLRQTTLVLGPPGAESSEGLAVFLAVDHCLFGFREMAELLEALSRRTGVGREQIVFFFSHTHGAGLLGYERAELPGGDLIPPYFERLAAELSDSVNQARSTMRPASIVYGAGQCGLATNRDYFDRDSGGFVCGYNPDGEADTTLIVARISDAASSQTLATMVNYACHPTTLAWQNTLISPDYVGAMREVIQRETDAPVFFMQGASGDIGPREGYVGDVAVADRNGRQLGHGALSVLEALPAAETSFEYQGPVVSGATLGTWKHVPISARRASAIRLWAAHSTEIPLAYRSSGLDLDELRREKRKWEEAETRARTAGDQPAASDARAMVERMTRRLTRFARLPAGDRFPLPVRLWRVGDAIWIALDGEYYNVLQRELRARFAGTPLVIGTLANGSSAWYLPDTASYGKGLYQEDASMLAAGSLETLIEAIAANIQTLLDSSPAGAD